MIDMTLPWPPKELSPNARVHWRQKHKHAKAYRRTCGLIALALDAPRLSGKKYFWVTFCPPNRRSYDDDNLLARFKAGRDGIADGLGIDDKNFVTTINVGEPVQGGAVRVHIRDYPIDAELAAVGK
ncbi:endodeoxyribonuclease RusA [Pseudomonas synxantha]|uniref:Endodeoxyribonuclease RusA n=1 Tax=Pseudomonas synxantha TaxID=47883 RepID=A0A5D3G0N8_9PSED|nr:endodeoxyribonuclease RusA [Pseudomonas synxantha]TYK53889.1 endodeoxyribonuclease RusA [Pseudomonas synxantha]TYK57278.1 endodeoxyribonuclease RusA [Pseudomonas synxantha]